MCIGSIPVGGKKKMSSDLFLERLKQEQERLQELEEKLADPAFTNDLHQLKELSREHARLVPRVQRISEYMQMYNKWQQAEQILSEETDKELRTIAAEEKKDLKQELNKQKKQIELILIPPIPHEGCNIFMEIRAGTGGDEAALFVSNLAKMYLRFAEQQSFRTEIISSTATELGGYKEIIFLIEGVEAYLFLHQEAGTHRVQRIPTTESGGRIHTSAVTVAVLPEREESELVINDSDLSIDVFRASGAGGQHVNKTESAIRITHVPSGLVVSCQDERSQHKNKARAMSILRSRLVDLQEQQIHSEENLLKREQIKSGDRSERIRTYNFPQGRITDHRINYTSYNLEAFIGGEIYELISALVETKREKQLQSIR